MKTRVIDKYVAERDAALGYLDPDKLLEVLVKYKKVVGEDIVKAFALAPHDVQMAAVCKMICNIPSYEDTDAYDEAVKWLTDHHMSTMI